MIYQADYYYSSLPNSGERSSNITFRAPTDVAARAAFVRWWALRQVCSPTYFHKLHCLKLYRSNPSHIGRDGVLMPSNMMVFEWKCDWGYTLISTLPDKARVTAEKEIRSIERNRVPVEDGF